MKAPYISILSEKERLAAMKLGASYKLAEHQGLVKTALPSSQDLIGYPVGAAKAIAALSLIAGVPIGIAAYMIGRKVKGQNIQDTEMEEKIKYYRNAAESLERGLASEGANA